MSGCDWCGKVITGESVDTIRTSAIFVNDSKKEAELMLGYVAYFCSHGCTWAFCIETHRLLGLSGKDLRKHLIDIHGLVHPPGKAGGGMRPDCAALRMARCLASILK